MSDTGTFFNHGYDATSKLTSQCTATSGWLGQPTSNYLDTYGLGTAGAGTERLDQYASINGATLTYDGRGSETEK